jgi:PPM family protein phosphatase
MIRVAEHYATTDTGRQRRANEDSLLACPPLFVVADGMGGAQAGEVASKLATDTFAAGLGDTSEPERELAARARAANALINALSHEDAEHAGMGTTLTAAYVAAEEVAIAHVGDSRAYRLRDGQLERLTDDHSLVDELLRQGKITPAEAVDHPQRSVITRALGPEPSVEIDTRSYAARSGDVYLLCSDGLTTMLSEPRVAEILSSQPRLLDAGEALVRAANAAGGRDNITVILFRLEDPAADSVPASPEPPTAEQAVAAATAGGVVGGGGAAPAGGVPARGVVPRGVVAGGVLAGGTSAATADEPSPSRVAIAQSPVEVRRPRAPTPAEDQAVARKRKRRRRAAGVAVVLVVAGLIAASLYLTLESVYFIGTNNEGLVTLYRGVPYRLPFGVDLYETEYVTGVAASTLTPARRRTLLNHELRSEGNAGDLLHSLELGQLQE